MQTPYRYAMISAGMNATLIAFPAAVLYIVGGLSTGLRLFGGPDRWRPPRSLGIALGFAGLLLHAALLYTELFTSGGLNLSFFNAVSLAAWTVVGLLLLSALTKPVENLAILALPLAARAAHAAALRLRSQGATALKPTEIMDVTPEVVDGAMREYRVGHVVHGHTHRPCVHALEVDGRPAARIVLGDWYDDDSVLRWHRDGSFALGRVSTPDTKGR